MENHDNSLRDAEAYIDDMAEYIKSKEAKENFKESIVDEIASTIKKDIHEFVMESIAPLKKSSFGRESFSLESYDHKDLIHHMAKEIDFLREELISKNKLIEMLLSRNEGNTNGNKKSESQNTVTEESNKKDNTNDRKDKKEKALSKKRKNEKPDERRENTEENTEENLRERKKVYIIGDSMLNGQKEVGFRKLQHDVKIRPHPGANTEDLIDHIKPILRRKKADVMIIHGGTNDLTSDGETTKNLEAINRIAKKISPRTKLVISNCVVRTDTPDGPDKVTNLNTGLKKMCENMKFDLIDNGNITENQLSRGKLHLNNHGNSRLAQNFIKYIRDLE